jgi:hypothetical protein
VATFQEVTCRQPLPAFSALQTYRSPALEDRVSRPYN